MQRRSARTLGNVIFILGLLLGLALAVAAVWGDFEAMSYFYTGAGYASFSGLFCPVLMSRSEVATVSATFDNSGNEPIQPYYEVEISGTVADRSLENQLTVPGHASRSVQWTVDANDVDLNTFVMVKMDVLPVAGYSTREATCGIVLLDLPGLRGSWALDAALILSLIGLVAGLALSEGRDAAHYGRELNMRNGMRAEGIAVLLAMLTGLLGWWLIGILFCAVAILLLFIMLRFVVA